MSETTKKTTAKESSGKVEMVETQSAKKSLFHFPELGLTIEATTREEAEKIAQKKSSQE